MKFRPCIDLHEGVVKQIVGSTLKDGASDSASLVTNFVATLTAADYAEMYAKDGLNGGHVIMLGKGNDEAAHSALGSYPGGLQVGDFKRLEELVAAVGKDHLVLDLSCRKRPTADGGFEYVVVTDRWQKFTDFIVNEDSIKLLAGYCDEFLVHGVDVEGMRMGVEDALVELLGKTSPIPVTYAGGVRNMADLDRVKTLGGGRVDVSVGSALDIFGGSLPYKDVVAWSRSA